MEDGHKHELVVRVEFTDRTVSGRRLIVGKDHSQYLSADWQSYKDDYWQLKLFERKAVGTGSKMVKMLSISYQGPEKVSSASRPTTQLSILTGAVSLCLQEHPSDAGEITYDMKVDVVRYHEWLQELGITGGYFRLSPNGQFASLINETDTVRRVQRVLTDGQTICHHGGTQVQNPWFDEFAQAEQDFGSYYSIEDATWTIVIQFDQELSGEPVQNTKPHIMLRTTATQLSKIFPSLLRYLDESGAKSFTNFVVA